MYSKSRHVFYVQNFFFENLGVYEIIWKNMIEPDMPQIKIITRHIRFACWTTEATETHSECAYCFSTATMVTRAHHNMNLCTHCLYCSLDIWGRKHPLSKLLLLKQLTILVFNPLALEMDI